MYDVVHTSSDSKDQCDSWHVGQKKRAQKSLPFKIKNVRAPPGRERCLYLANGQSNIAELVRWSVQLVDGTCLQLNSTLCTPAWELYWLLKSQAPKQHISDETARPVEYVQSMSSPAPSSPLTSTNIHSWTVIYLVMIDRTEAAWYRVRQLVYPV